jgi:hypothetical protein
VIIYSVKNITETEKRITRNSQMENVGEINVPNIACIECICPQPVKQLVRRLMASFIDEALKNNHAKVTSEKVIRIWIEVKSTL